MEVINVQGLSKAKPGVKANSLQSKIPVNWRKKTAMQAIKKTNVHLTIT